MPEEAKDTLEESLEDIKACSKRMKVLETMHDASKKRLEDALEDNATESKEISNLSTLLKNPSSGSLNSDARIEAPLGIHTPSPCKLCTITAAASVAAATLCAAYWASFTRSIIADSMPCHSETKCRSSGILFLKTVINNESRRQSLNRYARNSEL